MSKTYAMTGGATGIGAAAKELLQKRGDSVIVIDLKDADIIADLSKAEDRALALKEVASRAPEGLDGFIACAGVGPHVPPPSLIDRINFFGATVLIEGVLDLVAKKQGAIVVVVSNSAALPGLNEEHLELLLAGEEEKACEFVDTLDGHQGYAGSKNALAKWVRRNTPAFMKKGVRINAVAPGMTMTPLMDTLLADEVFGAATKAYGEASPYGKGATPEMVADAILFLLDPASRFVSGVVLFADGGQDAMMRPDKV